MAGLSGTRLVIRKMAAARSQIDTALTLYFNESDPVSIHSLTAAANAILADVNRARGGSPMARELFLVHFAENERGMARKKMKEAENFFKHADNDPDGMLIFDPAYTELLLLDACEKYHELTQDKVPSMIVFRLWFLVEAGKNWVMSPEWERQRENARRIYRGRTRATFLREAEPDALRFLAGL